MRDSSPPEDVDLHAASEAPTEVGSDDYVVVGGKRIPLSSYDPRCVVRQNITSLRIKYSTYPGP